MITLKDLRTEDLFVCLEITYSRLMVKNSSQNGSAHVVVIIILVVALVSALGFIFWQNLSDKSGNKPQDNSAPVRVSDESKNIEASNNLDTEYISLDDWKIKFKVPEGSNGSDMRFYKISSTDAYEFSTARIEALGGSCVDSDEASATRIATLRRTNTKEQEPRGQIMVNGNDPIDGYYYYIHGSQAACSDEGYDIQGEDRTMLIKMLASPISTQ